MAFPVIATTNTTADTDASPTTVAMPASISAGNLLIVICSADVGDTITQSGASDWTKLEQTNQAGVIGLIIFAKIASGGDTLTLTSAGSNDIACVSMRITGHGVADVSTDITRGTASTGTDASPNPPNCNPAVTKDFLWIECFGADDDDDTATYWSANYSAVAQIQSASSTTSSLCAVGQRNLNASSENPAVMAMALTEEWVAQTLAIPPVLLATQTWNIRHDVSQFVNQTWNIRSDVSQFVNQIWNIRSDISQFINNTWNIRHDISQFVNQTWNIRHDVSQFVNNIWNIRHDIFNFVNQVWNLRHDIISVLLATQIWNIRHDISQFVNQTWSIRHDISQFVNQIWNVRHDISNLVNNIWNVRHDISQFVNNTWNLRYDIIQFVNQTWNLRNDISQFVNNVWNIRHDVSQFVNNVWNIRHDIFNTVNQVWNIRHDISQLVNQIWTFRYDMFGSGGIAGAIGRTLDKIRSLDKLITLDKG